MQSLSLGDLSDPPSSPSTFAVTYGHTRDLQLAGEEDKKMIQEAAGVIAKHTCIRFVERADQDDYIEFYEDSR